MKRVIEREFIGVVLLGPPGSGKGTQSKRIASWYGIPHISPGNILRDAVKARTLLGMKVQKAVQRGELVSDAVVCALIEERLNEHDCNSGFVLDGFPRSIAQAVWLDVFLKERSLSSATRCGTALLVIQIELDEDQIFARLAGRRICESCGAVYNLYAGPPVSSDLCDYDGNALIAREDDHPEVLHERLSNTLTGACP